MQLKLYTTQGCHLCELALAQLLGAQQQTAAMSFKEIEIGDDDALVARYGTRIPVIAFPDGRELNWPFTEQDILNSSKI